MKKLTIIYNKIIFNNLQSLLINIITIIYIKKLIIIKKEILTSMINISHLNC